MRNKALIPPSGIEKLRKFNWQPVVDRYLASDRKAVQSFSALDLARALGAMIFIHKMDLGQATSKFGRSKTWADDRLKILHFPSEVQELFSAKRKISQALTADDAKYIFREPSERWAQVAQDILHSKRERKGACIYARPVD